MELFDTFEVFIVDHYLIQEVQRLRFAAQAWSDAFGIARYGPCDTGDVQLGIDVCQPSKGVTLPMVAIDSGYTHLIAWDITESSEEFYFLLDGCILREEVGFDALVDSTHDGAFEGVAHTLF